MKKLFLIAGIVLLIACILSLSFSALQFFGYRTVLDGSAELYLRLHRNAVIFLIVGVILAAMAAGCFLLRFKK